MNQEKQTRTSQPTKQTGNIFAGIGVIAICAAIIWLGWGLAGGLMHHITNIHPITRAALCISTAILLHASITKPRKAK